MMKSLKKIEQKGRDDDQQWRFIHTSVSKAAQPLVSAWNDIISAEAKLKDGMTSEGAPPSDEPATVSLPDGSLLDISRIRELLDLSLQTLGIANAQFVAARKSTMKPSLNRQYQELCDPKRAFTCKLFGENLRQQMEDINRMSKLASDVTSKHKSPAAKKWYGNQQQYQSRQNRSRFLDLKKGRARQSGSQPYSNFRQSRGFNNDAPRQFNKPRNRNQKGRRY